MYRRNGRARIRRKRGKSFWKIGRSRVAWWAVGLLFGLLCLFTFNKELRQSLAILLTSSLRYESTMDSQSGGLPVFIRRWSIYLQWYLGVWLCIGSSLGSWSFKGIIAARGFLQGYAQGAWIVAYGLSGLWYGLVTQGPPTLFFCLSIVGLERIADRLRRLERGRRLLLQGSVAIGLAALTAGAEAYGTALVLRAIG